MYNVKRLLLKPYRIINQRLKLRQMQQLGIQFLPPNYIYFGNFNESSVIIDVGCGHEAEFSKFMVKKYQLTAFGVDPTRKHQPFLQLFAASSAGKFHHLAVAVADKDGLITFNESNKNESGSILLDHTNVRNDEITTYEVETVSLRGLVHRTGTTAVDFLKLDLEGAEYDLLAKITDEDMLPFKQIFIEFHHHCTNHSMQETKMMVQQMRRKGFNVFTLDQHNYLFYRKSL